jgi:tRNA-Thr(GGU) m(6)t(6)A37 methyltransferase TsaA
MNLRPVGTLHSSLKDRKDAPRQGGEGAPDAWIEIEPWARDALLGIAVGDALLVLTWLHEADRRTLRVHPRSDPSNALAGVFATRSPDRPNPVGLHRCEVLAVDGPRLTVSGLEAVDGTPVVDVKIALGDVDDR